MLLFYHCLQYTTNMTNVISLYLTEDPYWFPAKRNVSRSNKHRIEVVVEDEDSPVDEHEEVNAAPCSV